MNATQEQLEKLKTLQESYDAVADAVEVQLPALADKIDNIDLTPIENKVQEESAVIQSKIDNIKLPEIDTTELAKQGENQEATNSRILDELKNITNEIVSGIMSRVNVEISYDGFTTSDGSVIKGGIDLLKNKGKVIKIVDDTSTTWDGTYNQLFGEQLKYVELKVASSLSNYPTCFANIEQFYADNAHTIRWRDFFYNSKNKQRVISLLNASSVTIDGTTAYMVSPPGLIDFRFGKGLTGDANVSWWNPIDALLSDSTTLIDEGEPFNSNLEKLLYNIREHIAANLNPNITATIIFSAEIKSAILASEETMNAFPASWTIA